MPHIYLDPGHQPVIDPGACYQVLQEASLTRLIAVWCANFLAANGVMNVSIVPDLKAKNGRDLLIKKIQWVNKITSKYDILVSIHVNASPTPITASGIEIWGYKGLPNKKFYQALLDSMLKETGLRNRGIKDETTNRHGRLGIIHDTKPEICCLIECGFINGFPDYNLLKNNPQSFALGIANGLVQFLKKPVSY